MREKMHQTYVENIPHAQARQLYIKFSKCLKILSRAKKHFWKITKGKTEKVASFYTNGSPLT